MNPRELITPWHHGFENVSENTKVYFVGNTIGSLTHQCPARRVPRVITLEMYQPTHVAKQACYCAGCDTLFIGDDSG